MGILDKLLGGIFGGGGETQSTSIPPWMEAAFQDNLARAQEFSRMGYMPYYGATQAAMTPYQTAAMANTASLAQQYGMQAPSSANLGMPTAKDYGGMQAYSAGDLFDNALSALQNRRPAQYQAYQDMFIDPQTGARSMYDQNLLQQQLVQGGVNPNLAQAAASGELNASNSGGYDFGQMGSGMENFLLGLATSKLPVAYGLGNWLAGKAIDNRMDAIDDQINNTYDLAQQGILTSVDSSGNVSNTFSPYVWNSTNDSPSWNETGNDWDSWGSDTDTTTTSYDSGWSLDNGGYSYWP